jgi:hypothetical protein
MSTLIPQSSLPPPSTEFPASNFPIPATALPSASASQSSSVEGSVTHSQQGGLGSEFAAESKESWDISLLIACILLMAVFAVLSCYMMFKEHQRKEKLSEKEKEIDAKKASGR